jgi:hypothetical protein
MLSEIDYRWLMVGTFEITKEDRLLYDLGVEYHRRTEAFDQMVCAHRNERGIAIPVYREERRACNLNAARIESELLDRARDDGLAISRHDLRRAIQKAAPRC